MAAALDFAEIGSSAVISADGRYRYRLDRWWASDSVHGTTRMPFLMLNPSTADADDDDPTIRRCARFARRDGHSGITVVNLLAFRSTDPDQLATVDDPIGPDNVLTVVRVAETAGYIVAAWGAHPAARDAWRSYLQAFTKLGIPVMCLGVTRDGYPRHPLYVRGDQPIVSYRAALAATGHALIMQRNTNTRPLDQPCHADANGGAA